MKLETYVNKYRKLFKERNPNIQTAHTNDGHFYVSGDEKYHSVTYYTSFIKDPSLSNWRMNRALEFMKDKQLEILETSRVNKNYFNEIVKFAKKAPEGQFQMAGDIGSQTHAWRQDLFQTWINEGRISLTDSEIDDWPMPLVPGKQPDPEVISGCRAIKKFLKETGYIPVACELALVDDELKVGGTIDDLGVFPAKTVIRKVDPIIGEGFITKYFPYLTFVDLKTSNQGKKPSYAFQVRGFYQRMIRKTFRVRPKKTYILHTSKFDGQYSLIDLTPMKFLEKDAEYLIHCSRSWDRVIEEFKPKVITI